VRLGLLAVFLMVVAVRADVRDCVCELDNPRTATLRTCSLCLEADKHSADGPVIFVKDVNPTKPNRWVVMPRAKYDGSNPLARMSQAERDMFWSAAVAKASEVWGDQWGIAINGDISRTQCHAHAHIGKLLEEGRDDNDTESGLFVNSVSDIPAINNGTGLWFHPVAGRLHVHTGGQVTEHILMR